MKKKLAALLLVMAVLLQFAFVTALAEGGPTFSVEADRATKVITVTGTGFVPGQMVSLIGAVDQEPNFINADYINQLTADENGNVNISFPSRYADPFLGGNVYYVRLNSEVRSVMMKATVVSINEKVSVTVKKGKTLQLNYTIDGIRYQFYSGNESIATVSGTGLVTGVKTGMTTITLVAQDGSNLVAYVVINVIA